MGIMLSAIVFTTTLYDLCRLRRFPHHRGRMPLPSPSLPPQACANTSIISLLGRPYSLCTPAHHREEDEARHLVIVRPKDVERLGILEILKQSFRQILETNTPK